MTEAPVMIVTGGGRGYGVCVNYLGNGSAAATVVREIEAAGGRAIAVQADVAQEDRVARLFETGGR